MHPACHDQKKKSKNLHIEAIMPLHGGFREILKLCLFVLVLEISTKRVGTATAAAGHLPIAKPGCPDTCGNVSVPFPFGLKEGCYLNSSRGFFLNCSHNETLFFSPNPSSYGSHQFRVSEISIYGYLYVYMPVVKACNNETNYKSIITSPEFPLSTGNIFTALGCDTLGSLSKVGYRTRCSSICTSKIDFSQSSACTGAGCCQISSDVIAGMWNFTIRLESILNHTIKSGREYPCSSALLTDESYVFKTSDLNSIGSIDPPSPTIIEWAAGREHCDEARTKDSYACKHFSYCEDTESPTTYRCICEEGDGSGNPYLDHGCPGSRKRFILMVLTYCAIAIGAALAWVGPYLLCVYIRKRKLKKRKEMLFRQNGGHLLQDHVSDFEGISNPIKIFTADEMKKATNNFSEKSIIGRGGFGNVYKGYLPELGTLAIKKPKAMDQTQIKQFINEVVLLSKIHHQNVVTFIGCCLEMDVPLLIFEFVTHGALHDHLHGETKQRVMPWGTRLKIAAETAGVLAYLHNNHRPPVIHRDVKPANILLDENYNTKVSDFGSSRLVPQSETQMYTVIQGTLGYLDPEYIHTSELTEKSDVYSFGVVLVELLTREKVVSFARSEEDTCLVMKFESSMKNNNVRRIIDQDILKEENVGEIMEVAKIAYMCLRVKGEERPTMDIVARQLNGLWAEVMHKWNACESYNLEENEHLTSSTGRPDTHASRLIRSAPTPIGPNNTTGTRVISWRLFEGR